MKRQQATMEIYRKAGINQMGMAVYQRWFRFLFSMRFRFSKYD